MRRFIVLLGPPGAGKGTQASLIAERLGIPHISSGAIFRENLQGQTELGKLAAQYIDKGELVPDKVTIAMIRERLGRPDCEQGALLDGFPRTRAQAKALDTILVELHGEVRDVPYIYVSDEVLVERLAGRWTCRAQGHVFHEKYHPPKQPGICDEDGSALYQREDDKPDTVKHRIQVYLEQTKPLIDYYQARGLLRQVEGAQPIDKVGADLLDFLGVSTELK